MVHSSWQVTEDEKPFVLVEAEIVLRIIQQVEQGAALKKNSEKLLKEFRMNKQNTCVLENGFLATIKIDS